MDDICVAIKQKERETAASLIEAAALSIKKPKELEMLLTLFANSSLRCETLDNLLLIYKQHPCTSEIHTKEMWETKGYSLKKGVRGIIQIDPDGVIHKLYDIAQTTKGADNKCSSGSFSEKEFLRALMVDSGLSYKISTELPWNRRWNPEQSISFERIDRTVWMTDRLKFSDAFAEITNAQAIDILFTKLGLSGSLAYFQVLCITYCVCAACGMDAFRVDSTMIPPEISCADFDTIYAMLVRIKKVSVDILERIDKNLKHANAPVVHLQKGV